MPKRLSRILGALEGVLYSSSAATPKAPAGLPGGCGPTLVLEYRVKERLAAGKAA